MSYRNYLAIIKNEDIEKSNNELMLHSFDLIMSDTEKEIFFKDIEGLKNQICLNKIRGDEDYNFLFNCGESFFKFRELNEYFSETNARIIDKDLILGVINLYKQIIIDDYKSLLESNEAILKSRIKDELFLWEMNLVYSIDEDNELIVRSDNLNYKIFELIKLYKEINWLENKLIIFGW